MLFLEQKDKIGVCTLVLAKGNFRGIDQNTSAELPGADLYEQQRVRSAGHNVDPFGAPR